MLTNIKGLCVAWLSLIQPRGCMCVCVYVCVREICVKYVFICVFLWRKSILDECQLIIPYVGTVKYLQFLNKDIS